ncbi:lysine N(6)-hydroxylase/L-ornithine N(5)-oxygenase family protein [Pleionea sediminis]|uniref:lysine N(6)-hydroxylase/L-ornithine N(5)-oxygenase family protein n=1 Tax=Pleionea sediminis TaxID=2569479 RepID=UPI00118581DE|nr:lysine N(6)-hydroxylase/L-ornithine N(5)-oxygenase family protein [Pleionea sediminis]
MNHSNYDFIAIGLGPFNLSLAALTEPLEGVNALFIDQNKAFDWHPGMMLENATLQTPFLSDLVTLADPTSPYSFLNYTKQHGRLYSFYIRESFFLMREEYNQYCQWVSQQLSSVQFNTFVEKVTYNENTSLYTVFTRCTQTNKRNVYQARKLVLGTGPKPYIPEACMGVEQKVVHSSSYLFDKAALQEKKSITIVGSGQSAAEIFYDLLQEIDKYNYQLNWVTRSPRFFPLEYTKLTLEMTSPEYIDYFFNLPEKTRDELLASQVHLYKGINSTLINDIFDLLYIKNLRNSLPVKLITNSELVGCQHKVVNTTNDRSSLLNNEDSQLTLTFKHSEQNEAFELITDGLIAASGYQYQLPDFLEPMVDHIRWDNQGRFDVGRNYSIDQGNESLFVQNAELHTHGFVTPDLGMACYRNSILLKELMGREIYSIEKSTAFQTFDVKAIKEQLIEYQDGVECL